jgi:hypothetical protein
MNEHQTELKAALAVLRQSLAAKQTLNRYHARAILLPLGACLRTEHAAEERAASAHATPGAPVPQDRDALSEEVRWVSAATQPHAQAWRAAIDDELEMAVTELVHGADPRFLGRKDFDWRYADASRALLDDRLRALDALGLVLDPALARHVEETDRRLAAARARHARPG